MKRASAKKRKKWANPRNVSIGVYSWMKKKSIRKIEKRAKKHGYQVEVEGE